MNILKLDNTGGLPFDEDILAFMQEAYDLFNATGEMAGNLSILKGCEEIGSNVTDGVVVIDGEILPFKSGAKSPNVVIYEQVTNLTFEDGVDKPVKKVRYAGFGNGTPFYPWADFKRVKNLQELEDKDTSLLNRLKKLEERVTKTVPLGLVAIWDRPADQIPEGWVEHTDLRGRVPGGHHPNNPKFNDLGNTIGSETHTLIESEMPKHSHDVLLTTDGNYSNTPSNGRHNLRLDNFGMKIWESGRIGNAGGDQPHNNIQPTRIVKFIRFVGFS